MAPPSTAVWLLFELLVLTAGGGAKEVGGGLVGDEDVVPVGPTGSVVGTAGIPVAKAPMPVFCGAVGV